MSPLVADSPGTPLRAAILHYFQWLAAASNHQETKTADDKENTTNKRGHKVVAALLEEFPELAKFQAPPMIPQPELKVRFEGFPLQLNQISFLKNRVAFLEQRPFLAAQQLPLLSVPNAPARAPKRKNPPTSSTTGDDGSANAKKRSTPPKQQQHKTTAAPQGTAAVLPSQDSAISVPTTDQQLVKTDTPVTPSAANKALKKDDWLSWDERYEQLVHFQKGYGHCRVPAKNHYKEVPGLGNWVIRQRANYRQGKLVSRQIENLNKIHFEWVVKEQPDTPWEVRYEELREFQREHGHVRVPRGYKKLGEWVHNQRALYKNKAKCIFETDRLAKLQAIGFEFTVNRGHKSWDERFQQLIEFRRENGHINVPVPNKQQQPEKKSEEEDSNNNNGDKYVPRLERDDETRFQTWVYMQRSFYRRYKNGDRNALTHSRFKKLDEIGFGTYEAPASSTRPATGLGRGRGRGRGSGSRPDDDTWNLRLQQLRQYKDQFGDCNVPVNSEQHKQLGEWVKNQRKSYRALLAGKYSSMTPERKEALENLGIQWTLRPWMLKENREKMKMEMKDSDDHS